MMLTRSLSEPAIIALDERRRAAEAATAAACGGDAEVAAVVALVAAARNVELSRLLDSQRCNARVAGARQLTMYLAHVMLSRSQTRLGKLFGRDRTTVAYACNSIEDQRDDPSFDQEVSALEDVIRSWSVEPVEAEVQRAAG